jgi:RNA-binding protein YhbY
VTLEVEDSIDIEDMDCVMGHHDEAIIIVGGGLTTRIILQIDDSFRLHELLTAAICKLQPLDDAAYEKVKRFKLNVERSQSEQAAVPDEAK